MSLGKKDLGRGYITSHRKLFPMKNKTTRNAPILEQEGEKPKPEGERLQKEKENQIIHCQVEGDLKVRSVNEDKCHMEVKEKEY